MLAHHCPTDCEGKVFDGPTGVIVRVVGNVVASAAEAEVAACFSNAQDALPLEQFLEE